MKHLLSTKDLSRDDAVGLLDIAEEMTQVSAREVKKLPVLRGRTVVNLFFEDSTRTRISFEAAAKRLSADVLNFSAKGSSVSKGESLQDTIQTLGAMGADAIVVRHPGSGTRTGLPPRDGCTPPSSTPGTAPTNTPPRPSWTPSPCAGSSQGNPPRDRPTAPAGARSKAQPWRSWVTCCIRVWPVPTSTCSTRWARAWCSFLRLSLIHI